MVLSELKINLKKWEIILSENVVSLTRNKGHPTTCLSYIIYCITIGKPFNLAYYIAKRMVSVTKSADMTLPFEMLLTRLFEHVRVAHPHALLDDLYLVDHVMIPFSKKRVFRIMPNGKRPRLPTLTPSKSFESPFLSLSLHQEEENDPVNNYTLDHIPHIDQLPPIKGGESSEFKQTKGMFKCFGHFLSNLDKKKTLGFTEHEREIYKSLEHRLFHEVCVIEPSYLRDQPNLRPTFAAIEFDCLLDINEKICLMFVLQFYKSVRLIRSLNGTLSGVDSNPDIYPPPHKDPLLIRGALFYQRPPGKTCKVKGVNVTLDPFQMVLSELKINLKKWEIILTYYIAKSMVSVTKSADMTLPFEMLLTRLFEHVRVAHPHALLDDLYLVDHVRIPFSKKRVFRIMLNGKRPRLPTSTPSKSFESPFLSLSISLCIKRRKMILLTTTPLTLFPTSINFHPLKEESHRNSSKPRGCSSALVTSSLT
nr:hypothetical protein [Tanacetum cinerariifolium]